MKNCWTYSVKTFLEREGFILMRFTRRSNAKQNKLLRFLGKPLVALGLILTNFGFYFLNGRWLHSYHCDNPSGPYTSYEPLKGVIRNSPPFSFEGEIVEKQTLKGK